MFALETDSKVQLLGPQAARREAVEQPTAVDAAWLRRVGLEAGADDVGFVDIGRPELDDDRNDILSVLPQTRALMSVVCRMHREAIRSPARSIANLEFHHTGDEVDAVGRRITAALAARGIAAVNVTMGFPMEMDRFPGKTWLVSHKQVAVAAGLGRMGIHRNVIHARFGNFILLGTVLIGAEISTYDHPLDFNPCLTCKLCVSACPVGAIGADGHFNFSACYTHNYRDFLSGFTDWVETIADSKGAREYRARVSDAESASMWQSLGFGPNYKAAYCMAVCPAGTDVIEPFRNDRKGFLDAVVRPLQRKEETIYVVAGSDAEDHTARRFPTKKIKPVHNGLRPRTIRQFLAGLRLTFQRDKSDGLDAIYHFTFTGEQTITATVRIRNKTLDVCDGHQGTPHLRVIADSQTWLQFLAKERGLVPALLRGKVRIKGPSRLLRAFARCFPS